MALSKQQRKVLAGATVAAGAVGLCYVGYKLFGGTASASAPAPLLAQQQAWPAVTRDQARKITTYAFPIDLRTHRFEYVDLAGGTAIGRTLANGGILGFNAGYFKRGFVPEGLQADTPFSRELGGGLLVVDGGRAALLDAETVPAATARAASNAAFAIQAKPRLVVAGVPNIRSDNGERAHRTALAITSDPSRLHLIVAKSDELAQGPTLFEFARTLVNAGYRYALNLDGGPSTALAWVGTDGQRNVMPPRSGIKYAVQVVPV